MQEIFDKLQESNVPASALLQGVNVVFADESDETLDMFRSVMGPLGWHGTYVHSAVEIIDTVNAMLEQNQPIDAVVADINYLSGPRVTGITAAREIRRAMPNVPIIFITSYVTSMIKEEVRRVNAEIFSKPFDLEGLFIQLAQLIYWNRLANNNSYEGHDRRRNSVNRTANARRVTDTTISTPDRIIQTIRELHIKEQH